MSNLSERQCVACRGGDPSLTETEIAELLPQIPDWQTVTQENIPRLQRVFKFKNYAQAVDFTNKIAVIAEEANHHPLMVVEWGKVTVQWWTHVVKGLHMNDFIMAAKTDELIGLPDSSG